MRDLFMKLSLKCDIATIVCLVIAKNIFAKFVKFADLIRRHYATVTAVPDAVTINIPLFSPSTS